MRIYHYLISINVAPGAYLHAYLMTADEKNLIQMSEKLVEEGIKAGFNSPVMNLIMVTRLTERDGNNDQESIEMVRSIIRKRSEEAQKMFDTATDFHVSMWGMGGKENSDDNEKLLELH